MDFGLNHQQPKINWCKERTSCLVEWQGVSESIQICLTSKWEMGYVISSNCHGQITQLIQENRSSIMPSMSVWISFLCGEEQPFQTLASKGLHHVNHPISSFSSHIPSASSSTLYGMDLTICFLQSWQDGVHRLFSAKQSWSYETVETTSALPSTFELKDLLDPRDVVQYMLTSRNLGTEMFQTPTSLYTPKSAVRLKQEKGAVPFCWPH